MPLEEKTGQRILVAAGLDSTSGRDGTTLLAIKTAFLNATDIGDSQIVALVTVKKIRVLGYTLSNGGASVATVHFRSGTTPICSNKDLAADGGGMVVQAHQGFLFETTVGAALNINLLAAGTVGVDITYVEV